MSTKHVHFFNLLKQQILFILEHNKNKKLAISFDIDGTLYKDGVYDPQTPSQYIKSVYDFFQYCKTLPVHLFIITARPNYPQNVYATTQSLKKHDVLGKDQYFLRPGENQITGKKNIREQITNQGYQFVMSIGDNPQDVGEYGGVGFLVYQPIEDPSYISFEKII